MTDIQIFTLAMAVLVPLSLLLLSNSRVSGAETALTRRVDDMAATLRAEMATLRVEVMRGLDRIESQVLALANQIKDADDRLETRIRIHELEHHNK